MGIERGHAAGVSTQGAARPAGGKGAAAQAAAAGGDFLAMLSALADGLPGGAALAAAPGEGALADQHEQPAADENAALVHGEAGSAAMAALLAAGAAATGAHRVAGPAEHVAVAAAHTGRLDGPAGRAQAADGMAALAVGQGAGAPGDAAGARAAVPTEGASAGAGAGAALAVGAGTAGATDAAMLRAAAAGAQGAEPASPYASVFEQMNSRLAAQDAASGGASGTTGVGARAPAAAQEVRLSERMSGPRPALRDVPAEAAALQGGAAGSALVGPGAAARGARTQDGGAGGRSDGGLAAPGFTPTVQYDAGLVSVDAPAPAPSAGAEAQPLAEQLRYWISQGVSSAEWTMAGDADPVQVSLSMQGNEASIAFRSEQAGTRELLAGAVDQLRDLLQREGVVLSGVSVGAHGSGAQGQQAGQEAAARAAVLRRPAGASVQAAAPVSAPAARSTAGGIDLFV